MGKASNSLQKSIYKELNTITKSEEKLRKKAKTIDSTYKDKLIEKIPDGLNKTLQAAFSKAFGIIFQHGIGIIEKSYNKEDIAANYDIQNFAIERKSNRRELRKLKKSASKSDFLNMSLTTVEGIGLGALGIGLPDIVLFIGMVLKGIYEVSLHYGYDHDSDAEKYLILKMMRTALSKEDEWEQGNREVDELMITPYSVDADILKKEIEYTSECFATDMLVLKFIQGLPLVGIVGGMFNPVYYNKILAYVRLKYYKRFLRDKLGTIDVR